MSRALLIVVSAPSGAGKTTLCDRLLADHDDIAYSVSCTTRSPRGNETDGEDYHFLSEEDFARRVAGGEFLEHAEVHGAQYGTLRRRVIDSLRAGTSIMMDIDVQGAEQIRGYVREDSAEAVLKGAFVDLFIEPPSIESLRARLERRAEDSPDAIERRLANVAKEMAKRDAYRYRVVNSDLKTAYEEFERIIRAEQDSGSIV